MYLISIESVINYCAFGDGGGGLYQWSPIGHIVFRIRYTFCAHSFFLVNHSHKCQQRFCSDCFFFVSGFVHAKNITSVDDVITAIANQMAKLTLLSCKFYSMIDNNRMVFAKRETNGRNENGIYLLAFSGIIVVVILMLPLFVPPVLP